MFHKREDRLRRLNDQLLAEEDELEEEYEEYDEGDLEDLEEFPEEEDLEDFFEEAEEAEEDAEPLYRNHANNYGADVRNYANRYGRGSQKTFDDDFAYDDGDFEEEEVLYRSDYRKAKRKQRRRNFGLTLLVILELIAIAAVAMWWLSWIL